ncbi:hypothetical protein B0H14DRAFT_3896365 [Mycena olivaceomarginata]|nr:hypothetical protein B0H14DRAFT_3896365 [Mycena olivaceomarginata]
MRSHAPNLRMYHLYAITAPPGLADDPPVTDPAKSSAQSSLFWASKKAPRRGELASVHDSAPHSGPPTLSGSGSPVHSPVSGTPALSTLYMADAPSRIPGERFMPSRATGSQVRLTDYSPLPQAPTLPLHHTGLARQRAPTPLKSTGHRESYAALLDTPRCLSAHDWRSLPVLLSPSKPGSGSTLARPLPVPIANIPIPSPSCCDESLPTFVLPAALPSRRAPHTAPAQRRRCLKLKTNSKVLTLEIHRIQARLYDPARALAANIRTGSGHPLSSNSFPPIPAPLLLRCPRLVPDSLIPPVPSLSCSHFGCADVDHAGARTSALASCQSGGGLAALCCRTRRPAAHARVWRRLQKGSAPLQPSLLVPPSGAPRDHLPLISLLSPCLPVVSFSSFFHVLMEREP